MTSPWTFALPLLDLPEAAKCLSSSNVAQLHTLTLPNAYYNFSTNKFQLEEPPENPMLSYFEKYVSIFSLLRSMQSSPTRLNQMEALVWLNSYFSTPEIVSYIRTQNFNGFLTTGEVTYD
jgi:hypothetical protein